MDVFLVPVGADRYELYCEVPDEPEEAEPEVPRTGFRGTLHRFNLFRRMKRRFMEMLAEAERERRHGQMVHHDSWVGRTQAKLMRWVAESIAEQRLLWTLRRQTEACYHYPDDMTETGAVGVMRKQLGRDFEKHRFWLIIDTLGFLASGALMLVPGPNVLAYYFAFRLVGHFFSLRGARNGLSQVAWAYVPNHLLAELRRMIHIAPEQREQQVQDVAGALRLEHLAKFFQRSAIPSA